MADTAADLGVIAHGHIEELGQLYVKRHTLYQSFMARTQRFILAVMKAEHEYKNGPADQQKNIFRKTAPKVKIADKQVYANGQDGKEITMNKLPDLSRKPHGI